MTGQAGPCIHCGQPGICLRRFEQAYCAKHYRLHQMLAGSIHRKLACPPVQKLEILVPADMKCRGCGKTMNWLRSEGGSLQITINHDDDGSVSLICMACNQHHRNLGDDLYSLGASVKRCTKCGIIKPLEEFYKRSMPNGSVVPFTRCKDCKRPIDRARSRERRALLKAKACK